MHVFQSDHATVAQQFAAPAGRFAGFRDRAAMMDELGLLVLGIVLTAGSAYFFMRKRERYRSWVRTTGTVLELASYSRDHPVSFSGGGKFAPRLSFVTASGETIEFKSPVYSNNRPAVGSKIVLLYDPGNPQEVVFDRFLYRHFQEMIGFAFGIGCLQIYVMMKFLV